MKYLFKQSIVVSIEITCFFKVNLIFGNDAFNSSYSIFLFGDAIKLTT